MRYLQLFADNFQCSTLIVNPNHRKIPRCLIARGIMSSNIFVLLVFRQTDKKVCTRCNPTKVQTMRQFIHSWPTDSRSLQRNSGIYIYIYQKFCWSSSNILQLSMSIARFAFKKSQTVALPCKLILFF